MRMQRRGGRCRDAQTGSRLLIEIPVLHKVSRTEAHKEVSGARTREKGTGSHGDPREGGCAELSVPWRRRDAMWLVAMCKPFCAMMPSHQPKSMGLCLGDPVKVDHRQHEVSRCNVPTVRNVNVM